MSAPINTTANLTTELTHHLRTKHLPPKDSWIQSFLSTQNQNQNGRPPPPLPALKQTALFRLLNTDITTSISTQTPGGAAVFPSDIAAANPPTERTTSGTILVQVLDVQDVSSSRWSQIEALEARERGEGMKGREVIRVTDEDPSTTSSTTADSGGGGATHKLLLQDAAGHTAHAFEVTAVKGVGVGMAVGCKMLLRGLVVGRGVVLLEGGKCEVLGGKVEVLWEKWKEGRKERLRGGIGGGEGG